MITPINMLKTIKSWWFRLNIVNYYYFIKNRKKNVRKVIWNYLWDMQSMWWTYTCRSLNGNQHIYSWITDWWVSHFKNQEEILNMSDNEFYSWLKKVSLSNWRPSVYNPVTTAIEVFKQTHFRIASWKIWNYKYKQI